jgi:chromatin assembly factor 1 subunit B
MGWHGPKDRILSIDFHPFENEFASAGSDEKRFVEEEREGTEGCIKFWEIINDGQPIHPDKKNIRILYGLFEADKNTNIVRYSPHGGLLASGSDDKCITIWERRENCVSINRSERMMRWSTKGRLMGHTEDVLDLRWTPNSRFIVSAGMDKRIFVWNVEKKYHVKVLDEHEKFVQGIAIDLRFEHIISCSNDRTVKIWKAIKTKKSETEFYCKRSLKRFDYQKNVDEDTPDQKSGFRIFAD